MKKALLVGPIRFGLRFVGGTADVQRLERVIGETDAPPGDEREPTRGAGDEMQSRRMHRRLSEPRRMTERSATAERAHILRGGYDRFDRIFASRFREIRNGFSRALEPLLATVGISYGQWRCLRVLCDSDGISQRELSDLLDMSSAAVVFAVNSLERDGIARRVPDPSDKRRIFIKLKPKGYRLEKVLLAESRAVSERIFASLSDAEVITLDRLLTKVRNGQLAELERQANS